MDTEASGTIAVIIPVYNGERFIERALDSVLAQTLAPAEIFVVDDGSKDRTLAILAAYGDRISVISQQNGGPAKARNAALRQARSEFIAFLDADDWWEPRKLEVQRAAMLARPDAVANCTGLHIVQESDGSSHDELPPAPESLWPRLRWCNPGIPPSCLMARRAVLLKVGGFDERQVGTEDWSMWFKLNQAGPFCVCPEPLTDYRAAFGGLSGNPDHMFQDFLKMLEDTLLSGLSGVRRWVWRRRIISYQAFRNAMTARWVGKTDSERRLLKVSVLTWPSPWWTTERFKAFAVTFFRAKRAIPKERETTA